MGLKGTNLFFDRAVLKLFKPNHPVNLDFFGDSVKSLSKKESEKASNLRVFAHLFRAFNKFYSFGRRAGKSLMPSKCAFSGCLCRKASVLTKSISKLGSSEDFFVQTSNHKCDPVPVEPGWTPKVSQLGFRDNPLFYRTNNIRFFYVQ